MKVLHIISDLRRGGRERQLSVLCHYSKPEVEHHIIAFHNVEKNYLEEYDIKKINYLSKNKIKRIFEIFSYVKKEKINLIHSWGNSETLYALPASLFSKAKLLNGSIRHGIRPNKFSYIFRSFVLRRSKYLLANSFAGLKANKVKVNNERHFVLYNGIEDKFFIPFNKQKRKEFLTEKNLPEESIIFISIANFIPFKEYFTPLKALSDLAKENCSFHYFIIGHGPLENEVRAFIKKLNLSDKTTIFNNKPNIPELLSYSDIMIHSSLGEGCSNAILEAKAAGLIVVASNTGGTKEIVSKNDYLFEYKNSTDLSDKIHKAILMFSEKPELRKEIQEETKNKYNVNTFFESYKNIIKKILKN